MVKLALGKEEKIEVVNDQKGQPTSAIHLARQIHMLVSHDATPGIYHGTNSGETTWFHLARRVFEILGQDPERIIPISSLTTSRKARRPSYSVLGHEKWHKEGLQPMNKWEEDLEYILPEVLKVLIEIEGFDGN
jgi:dTDP-4-dehydrorhamnose reductase